MKYLIILMCLMLWISCGSPLVWSSSKPSLEPTNSKGSEASPGAPSILSDSASRQGGQTSVPSAKAFTKRFLRWLGKFHVLVVHFPIALLVAGAAAELWFLVRGNRGPAPAVRFCVLLGAAAAAVGAALGWLNAGMNGFGADFPTVLTLHRWTGTAAALAAIIVAILVEVDSRRGIRRPLSRLTLFLATALVSLAGHLGGTLVFGEDYFKW